MGSHSTYVPNSILKSEIAQSSRHTNDILVLVHNAMYMAHTTLRLVFNLSSFPLRPTKIEVWPIFKLKISTADLHITTLEDRSSVHQGVGTLLSTILKCEIKTHRNM